MSYNISVLNEKESGTKLNRAELLKLLDVVQSGDSVVATEVIILQRISNKSAYSFRLLI